VFGDPCDGVSKVLVIVARCSSGGGTQPGGTPATPIDLVSTPKWVNNITLQTPATGGFCGARIRWAANASKSHDMLQDPRNPSGNRSIGAATVRGCPTFIIDVTVADQSKKYRMSAYFIDFDAAGTEDGSYGEPRSQEVYLMTGYPQLNPMTPRQLLRDFARGGVWMTYELRGDVRFRVATIRGPLGVVSALAFDEVPDDSNDDEVQGEDTPGDE
jgi:hypothetical protein